MQVKLEDVEELSSFALAADESQIDLRWKDWLESRYRINFMI